MPASRKPTGDRPDPADDVPRWTRSERSRLDRERFQGLTAKSHLEQVAAALAPLRASNSRGALATAVARLVTGVAAACRVDVAVEDGEPDALAMLSRMIRPDRADLSDPAGDLGEAEAVDAKAAVIADRARGLSWVVIPLVANGRTEGALRVALDAPTGPAASELAYLHHIASSLAMGLSSAGLQEQSERVSRRLQESLLPHALPTDDWFHVAARYVPATAGMHVGGDWYDAQLMAPDELAFSVGDVAGHGVEAAARMGELRSAMQAFRLLSRAPDDLIQQLHRLCDPMGDFATAICGRLDPSGGFRWASAGHLPPILARSNREVVPLWGSQSPPLGTGLEASVRVNHSSLAPGDMVLLYTDGLVERREEPLDVSVERLTTQVAAFLDPMPRPHPGELLDALLGSRRAAGPMGDDIAVIAVVLLAPA
jgi:serine phosphatase RsbU (regulator of sigma subunit)